MYDRCAFKIFDAGGQRAERRKWIHCFDGVTAVVFVASLTGYDEVLFEDETKNSLVESLELFEEIVNLKAFESTPLILYLNKKDLFEKHVKNVPLDASDQLEGAPHSNSYSESLEWITDAFRSRVRDPERLEELVHVHATTATSRKGVRKLFDSLREVSVQQLLGAGGLLD